MTLTHRFGRGVPTDLIVVAERCRRERPMVTTDCQLYSVAIFTANSPHISRFVVTRNSGDVQVKARESVAKPQSVTCHGLLPLLRNVIAMATVHCENM